MMRVPLRVAEMPGRRADLRSAALGDEPARYEDQPNGEWPYVTRTPSGRCPVSARRCIFRRTLDTALASACQKRSAAAGFMTKAH